MLALLSLLACTPPKITLDSGLDDRTLDETEQTDDTGTPGASDDTAAPDGGDDTGVAGGDDTAASPDDTAEDTGGDTSGDTGDTGEPKPDPVPDYSVWQGTRTFITDDCEEVVEETGFLLDESWEFAEYLGDVEAACTDCTHFYYITASTDSVCGWYGIEQEFYRGLKITEDSVDVYSVDSFFLSDDTFWIWADVLDDGNNFDGWTFDYGYDDWWGAIIIDGTVEFPAK